MGGWDEEVYYSRWEIAKCYHKMHDWSDGKSVEETIKKYMECYRYHPHRAEPLYEVGKIYMCQDKYKEAKSILFHATHIPCPDLEYSLFLSHDVYQWRINFELARCYEFLGEHQLAYDIYNDLSFLDLDDNTEQALEWRINNCKNKLGNLLKTNDGVMITNVITDNDIKVIKDHIAQLSQLAH
jgi:tetratricopeptide (TPR) repeat protein